MMRGNGVSFKGSLIPLKVKVRDYLLAKIYFYFHLHVTLDE